MVCAWSERPCARVCVCVRACARVVLCGSVVRHGALCRETDAACALCGRCARLRRWCGGRGAVWWRSALHLIPHAHRVCDVASKLHVHSPCTLSFVLGQRGDPAVTRECAPRARRPPMVVVRRPVGGGQGAGTRSAGAAGGVGRVALAACALSVDPSDPVRAESWPMAKNPGCALSDSWRRARGQPGSDAGNECRELQPCAHGPCSASSAHALRVTIRALLPLLDTLSSSLAFAALLDTVIIRFSVLDTRAVQLAARCRSHRVAWYALAARAH
eukprot:424508-Prymnesium_polylepis.1